LVVPLHQAIRSKNRRMKELSPKVYRVNLPTVFSANSPMQRWSQGADPTWYVGRSFPPSR